MHNHDRESLTATTQDFLTQLATSRFSTAEQVSFLKESMRVVANSLRLYEETPTSFLPLIEKIERNNPEQRETIRLIIQQALHRAKPEVSAPAPRPVVDVSANDTCAWTNGKLSHVFGQHCGAPVASMEERASLHQELGYGVMQPHKVSLCRSQPYCTEHLRASIRPAHKQVLD